MTNAAIPDDESDDFDDVEFTPEQMESMRRTLARLNESVLSKITFPKINLPDSLISTITESTRLLDARLDRLPAVAQQLMGVNARFQEQMASIINSDALKSIAAAQASFAVYAERLTRNIDFAAIAAVSERFAKQQAALFENIGPAMEAMRARFYPPNLRGVARLEIESVNLIVMSEGIPLYGLPRTSVAEALIRAEGERERRAILGRRWKSISMDCRELVTGCTSAAVAKYVPVALAALDALDAGHPAAAQALAGSLTDAIVTDYFGSDRYKYTPNKKNPTTAAYDEFTIREFIAFAPIWRAYQQFFASNGDTVPTTFSRNATAHTVSTRQFSRRNALQGLMLVCSLLYRWNEEASRSR